jgi:hypothetical protein
MKFSILATILATASAQVIIVRPDKTTGVINNTPGCYGIYPDIAEVKNADNLKLEFYNDWNCKGSKVEETNGNRVFNNPVNALSIKVSPKSRARHLRASHRPSDDRFSLGDLVGNSHFLDDIKIDNFSNFLSDYLPGFVPKKSCNLFTHITQGCN